MPQPQRIEISLYDALGRKLRRVADRRYGAGAQRVAFAVGDLAAGVYYVAAEGQTARAAKALTVVR